MPEPDRAYVERLLAAMFNEVSLAKAGGKRLTLEQVLANRASQPAVPADEAATTPGEVTP